MPLAGAKGSFAASMSQSMCVNTHIVFDVSCIHVRIGEKTASGQECGQVLELASMQLTCCGVFLHCLVCTGRSTAEPIIYRIRP